MCKSACWRGGGWGDGCVSSLGDVVVRRYLLGRVLGLGLLFLWWRASPLGQMSVWGAVVVAWS